MDKFVISCDFVVLNIDENFQVTLILGRPFFATAGAVIDVQVGTMSFHLCGEKVDFCFPSPTLSLIPSGHLDPAALILSTLPTVISGVEVTDGDRGPHMRSLLFTSSDHY